MLFYVFFLAFSLFTNPAGLSKFINAAPTGKVGSMESMMTSMLGKFTIPLFVGALLWVLGSVAARIANQGRKLAKREK